MGILKQRLHFLFALVLLVTVTLRRNNSISWVIANSVGQALVPWRAT